MILVDTSVWIDHLRKTNKRLVTLLLNDMVLTHPFVVGELACGHLKNRKEILDLLQKLPAPFIASQQEALITIETDRLYGKGLGFVDIHLLVSAKLSKAKLWTFDRSMANEAGRLKINF